MTRPGRTLRGVLSLCTGWGLLVAGCTSQPDRLAPGNYAQIQQHASTQGEVAALLGQPTNRLENQWLYERPEQHLFVFVDFDDAGCVTRKQWIDATSGQWDDTRDAPLPGRNSTQTIRHSTGRTN